jgi:DHA2 family methylenomycin A resistance protein-like MFS transporter
MPSPHRIPALDRGKLFIGGCCGTDTRHMARVRFREPMLPPEFFANRVRTVAVVCASLMGFLFYGTLFMMSLYFQLLRGWSPGLTGAALLPLTVGTLAGPFLLYGRLSRRFGHPVLLVAGFVCCALGVGLLAQPMLTARTR